MPLIQVIKIRSLRFWRKLERLSFINVNFLGLGIKKSLSPLVFFSLLQIMNDTTFWVSPIVVIVP